ncbi:DUF4307 domain-containing protein [Nocardioides sp. W7]|uniref:DUF4307 domain-containing protein n=1 Tax=Nocardioides sp. W7 TaxID=2931390 RepID=UPI001FD62E95|nr:DUF4307 domain-containing protein [Nocardioides sp. W7]
MTSQDSPATLAERYGAPSPWRRRATWVACALLGVVALGWLAWTIVGQTSKPVDSDLVSFDLVDEHTTTALVDVRVRDDATGVACLLRAFAEDHNVVGELSFTPAADDPDRTEQTIRTERLATSVEFVGCTADGQERPS